MQNTSSGEMTCQDVPCQNGGTCVDKEDGGVKCACTEEFVGDYCKDIEFKGNADYYTLSTSNT